MVTYYLPTNIHILCIGGMYCLFCLYCIYWNLKQKFPFSHQIPSIPQRRPSEPTAGLPAVSIPRVLHCPNSSEQECQVV